jgi:hypothetical protein
MVGLKSGGEGCAKKSYHLTAHIRGQRIKSVLSRLFFSLICQGKRSRCRSLISTMKWRFSRVTVTVFSRSQRITTR